MKEEIEEIEIERIDEIDIVAEKPAFTLSGWNGYSNVNSPIEHLAVSFSELKNSKIGAKWEMWDQSGGARDSHSQTAENVYKTASGCAVLFNFFFSTDTPDPVEKKIVKLIWYEFQ
ncbi:hypothetical protein [Mycobacterium sp.]|uniref:hypothetical protein n=1 Tax=Mycobacterium sp. TaxID=1785 RepID=UPI0031DB46AE